MTGLEWRIAGRYLRSRRSSRLVSLITIIATAGVTVGVMALVVVLGVMNGLQRELREKILVASPHIRVFTHGLGFRMDEWRAVRDLIAQHPDVRAAAPFVLSQALVTAGADYNEGVRVIGIDPDTGSVSVTDLPGHFVRGDLSFAVDRDDVDGGIVLGRRVGQRLSATEGQRVSVVSSAGTRYNSAVGAFVPQYWSFEVAGHFDTGMYEYDNSYVVLPLDVAQRFAGLDSAVSGIEVRVANMWDAPDVARDLEIELGPRFFAVDWQTQNVSLFSALKLEKLGMGLVLTLIVVVAAFNIVGTLTMVVTDKTREIGILRAMGLPARSVRNVFVFQGAVIGLVGTVLGTTLGVIVAFAVSGGRLIQLNPEVYFIDHLPVDVQALDVGIVILASMVVAVLATVHPARQAAGFTPVEAIRHE